MERLVYLTETLYCRSSIVYQNKRVVYRDVKDGCLHFMHNIEELSYFDSNSTSKRIADSLHVKVTEIDGYYKRYIYTII